MRCHRESVVFPRPRCEMRSKRLQTPISASEYGHVIGCIPAFYLLYLLKSIVAYIFDAGWKKYLSEIKNKTFGALELYNLRPIIPTLYEEP